LSSIHLWIIGKTKLQLKVWKYGSHDSYFRKMLMINHNMQRIISGETVLKIDLIGHPFAIISKVVDETLIGQLRGSGLKDR